MSGIVIAGTALDVTDGGEGDPILVGEESRAYAGNLRGSVRAQKRQFSIQTAPMLEATWDTIRAAVANGAQVTVSGAVLSGDSFTASCKATAKAVPGLPGYFVMSITGQEV